MAGLELLNAVDHAGLRLPPPAAAERHFVQLVVGEFARAAARCPILFTKHPETGQFYAGAVFGFTPGENLLVDAAGMLDGHMPLDLERAGFFVADDRIALDRAHPRFAEDVGPALFTAQGEPGDELRRVQRALTLLKSGLDATDVFIRRLLALKLVEPIDISLSFDDGKRVVLEGLYTISRDAIGELDDDDALALFREGHLQLAYTMIGSLEQIALLARRRNDRLLA